MPTTPSHLGIPCFLYVWDWTTGRSCHTVIFSRKRIYAQGSGKIIQEVNSTSVLSRYITFGVFLAVEVYQLSLVPLKTIFFIENQCMVYVRFSKKYLLNEWIMITLAFESLVYFSTLTYCFLERQHRVTDSSPVHSLLDICILISTEAKSPRTKAGWVHLKSLKSHFDISFLV